MSGLGWDDYNPPSDRRVSRVEPASKPRKSKKSSSGARGRITPKTRIVLAVMVAALAGVAGVSAYFSSTGTGAATAGVGRLNPPTSPSASTTVGTGVVSVSWTASSTTDGVAPQGYYATRIKNSDGSQAAACGSSAASLITGNSCSDTSVADGTYHYVVTAVYRSWSAVSGSSDDVTVVNDNTAPSTSLSLDSRIRAFLAGAGPYTLYFKSNASGSFRIADAVTDNGSGPASATFPGVSASGWSGHTASELVTSGSGSAPTVTYTSSGTQLYQWSAGASTPAAAVVTARDAAGNSRNDSVTFVSDTTNPVSGALSVAGTAATGAGAAAYNSSGSFNISSITDYTDAGSGLASSTLVRDEAPLSSSDGIVDGTCGAFGNATTITSRSTPIAQSLSGPTCYRYTLTGTDNVGNTASISVTVKVDTTAPTAGTISANGGNTYNRTGSVSIVTAGFSDADSGIGSTTLKRAAGTLSGDICGTLSGATNVTLSSGNDSSTLATGCYQYTFTVTNNAGTSSSAQSGVVKVDRAAPTGGSITANGSGAYNNTGTLSIATTAFADGETGIASTAITRASGTLAGDSCGTISGTTAVTLSGGNDSASLATGCYQYTFTGTDKAGNSTTRTSAVVKVDLTAPTGGTIAANGGNTYNNTGIVSIATSAFSDAETAVASSTITRATGTLSGDTCGTISGNTTVTVTGGNDSSTLATGCYQYTFTGTDKAGNATSRQSGIVKVDRVAPTGGSITANSGNTFNTTGSISVSTTAFSDAETGIASTSITRANGTLTNNACGTISGAAAVTLSGGNDSASLATGCYQYTFTGTDKAGNSTSRTSSIVKVDVDLPTGSITAPANGATISSGSATVTSNSADVGSGVASAQFQFTTSGGSTWTTIGTANGSPYSVTWNTNPLTNGAYDLRVIMTDNAGNTKTTGGTTVTVSNTYSLGFSTIATQRAGTAFGGFTIQLQVNGSATGTLNGISYSGNHAITFGGAATANSPNANVATGLSQTLSFNSSGLATVPAGSITLFKAQAAVAGNFTASDAGNSLTGLTSFAVDSAGVTLAFSPSGNVTMAKNATRTFTILVPNDAFGNVFTSAAGLTVNLSLSSTAHMTFAPPFSGGTAALTITSGPANNTFGVAESGNNGGSAVTLSGSVAAPFTSPASDTLNENG